MILTARPQQTLSVKGVQQSSNSYFFMALKHLVIYVLITITPCLHSKILTSLQAELHDVKELLKVYLSNFNVLAESLLTE